MSLFTKPELDALRYVTGADFPQTLTQGALLSSVGDAPDEEFAQFNVDRKSIDSKLRTLSEKDEQQLYQAIRGVL